MAKEDALAATTLAQKDKGFALGDIEINPLQDFLSADRLSKIANLDEIVGARSHQ
jgi:hypothetical protein